MFKRYTEYREMQQLRKDHLAKQKMRYALIALVVMIPLFAVLAVIEAAAPAEPVKAVKSETKTTSLPLEELSGKELVKLETSAAKTFYGYKFTGHQAKYCLLVATGQSGDEITAGMRSSFSEKEINARTIECTTETDSWSFNRLEAELETMGEGS